MPRPTQAAQIAALQERIEALRLECRALRAAMKIAEGDDRRIDRRIKALEKAILLPAQAKTEARERAAWGEYQATIVNGRGPQNGNA